MTKNYQLVYYVKQKCVNYRETGRIQKAYFKSCVTYKFSHFLYIHSGFDKKIHVPDDHDTMCKLLSFHYFKCEQIVITLREL